MKHIFIFFLFLCIAGAQEKQKVYEVPIASKGNVVELSVANSSNILIQGIKVNVANIPAGIKFADSSSTLAEIEAGKELVVPFKFSVEKTAEINKEKILSFTITDKNGQSWQKDITIKITPPTTFDLCQNYPNPFNPATTIEYQLPGSGTKFDVSLKIYDMLGREVVKLVDEMQEPGYYQKTFNASNYASGVYIYRLIAKDTKDDKHIFQKKMMLLK